MRKRIVAAALAVGVALAACGGAPEPPVAEDGTVIALPEPAAGPVTRPAGGRPDAASGSPLPEVAVRQINGDGGWVQFKNELPSDKPLLVWFWSPH